MIVEIANDDSVLVIHSDSSRAAQLSLPDSRLSNGVEKLAFRAENFHDIISGVRNDEALSHVAESNGSRVLQFIVDDVAKFEQEHTFGREHLDSVVVPVGDYDSTFTVHGNTWQPVKLSLCGAFATDFSDQFAGFGAVHKEAVVVSVSHNDVLLCDRGRRPRAAFLVPR